MGLLLLLLVTLCFGDGLSQKEDNETRELHFIALTDITGQFKSWPWAGNVALMAVEEVNNRDDILPGITLVPHFVDTVVSLVTVLKPR